MPDLLIEQFCQMLAEHLEENGSVSKSESIAFLQSFIQADARLRTVFEDRMVQFNQGNAVGFQTWLESGARGFFGTNYVVHDPSVLREGMRTLLDELAKRPVGTPSNLPLSGVVKFVGREEKLAQVHEKLQIAPTVAVTSVSGMGGVGKTELALQYAYQHLQANTYLGGLCWINVRSQDVGLGLLEFARAQLGLPEPPDVLETLLEKVQWVCRRWQGEPILVVLDDVTDYETVNPYLNLLDSRFRVLITTRLKLLASSQRLELEVLTEAASLELLRVLLDNPRRIDSQLADAQRLCEWLGYLPLGLELVGRYLTEDEDISFGEMLDLLLQERLAAEVLLETYPEMTANLGIATAFELSWKELTDEAKKLSGLLSIFALAPIPWNLVEQCLPDWEKKQLKQCRDRQLKKCSLLSRVGQELYQLHQLIREFFAAKRKQIANDTTLKQVVCQVMATTAHQSSPESTLKDVQSISTAIPHLQIAAEEFASSLNDEDLIWLFTGIAHFYNSQGLYKLAETWYKNCLSATQIRFGEIHVDVANSLNNLAEVNCKQGHYSKAEEFHVRALQIRVNVLGEFHSAVAISLNNLAEIYHIQGHYSKAEQFHLRALELRLKLLNELRQALESQLKPSDDLHFQVSVTAIHIASSLNNLAALYSAQKRYGEAEDFYQKALQMLRQFVGEEHSYVATSLNNLAELYRVKGQYKEAEPLYEQVLQLRHRLFGEVHLATATSLNNLALLYTDQKRYIKAEPLYQRALQVQQQLLGEKHQAVANSLNNLAALYAHWGRYAEAESLFVQALEMCQQLLGSKHPDTIHTRMSLGYLRHSISKSSPN